MMLACSGIRHCTQLYLVVPSLPDSSVIRMIDDVRVPPLILGDSAYPLQDWLMKPYVDRGNLSREETHYNNLLSVTRVVENAFGRLKGRFNSLGKRLDLNANNCATVTAACCVLHNFCEIMNEEFDEEWLLTIEINNGICLGGDVNQNQDRNAAKIREAIKSFLSQTNIYILLSLYQSKYCITWSLLAFHPNFSKIINAFPLTQCMLL